MMLIVLMMIIVSPRTDQRPFVLIILSLQRCWTEFLPSLFTGEPGHAEREERFTYYLTIIAALVPSTCAQEWFRLPVSHSKELEVEEIMLVLR